MDIDQAVRAEIMAILRSRGRDLPDISPRDGLATTLGLSSLELAALAARLTALLGKDPFSGAAAFADMKTVADLSRAYRTCASAASPLQAAAERAERRRKRPSG
jgi:hypothetical protein